jgi:hypothetical protein
MVLVGEKTERYAYVLTTRAEKGQGLVQQVGR